MRQMLSLVLVLLAPSVALAAGPNYHVSREIQIGGEGGWDYLILDSATHRLYVSHATKVVVADAESGKIVGEIPDLAGVHGIAIASDLGRGFTSNGRANSSTIFDLKTLKPIATVGTGANPDSIRYLADRKEVWTFNHTGGSITAFDPMSGKVIATIPVGGELEEAVEDIPAQRVFVNIEDTSSIGVIDTVKHTLVATWPIAGCEGPTGLAFDSANHLLLSACDGKMVITDSKTGKGVSSFPTANRVDGNGYDPATGLAFASSGTGVLTVAHQDAPGRFTVTQTAKTAPSGRTMFVDLQSHAVYVPVADSTTGPNGRAQLVPGTMKVLVLELDK